MAVTKLSAQRRRKTKQFIRAAAGRAPFRTVWPGLLIGFLAWAAALFLFYIGGSVSHVGLALDQRAPVTIVAATDFTCPDLARSALRRQQEAEAIGPVFEVDQAGLAAATQTADKLFEWLAMSRSADGGVPSTTRTPIEEALFLMGLQITPEEVLHLAPAGEEAAVREVFRRALRGVWEQGVISAEDLRTGFDGLAKTGAVSLLDANGVTRAPAPIDQLRDPDAAVGAALEFVRAAGPMSPERDAATRSLLAQLVVPNLRFDPATTDASRAEARKQARPEIMQVRTGTTIVQAGERITPQTLEMIIAHEQRRSALESPQDRFFKFIASGSLLLLGLVGVGAFLRAAGPALLSDTRALALMALLGVLTLLPVKGLLYLSSVTKTIPTALTEPLLPLALGPMLAAVLLGAPAAFAVGLWVSLAAALMYGHSFPLFFLGFVLTAVVCATTSDVTRRSSLLRSGLSVGLGAVVVFLCLGIMNQQAPRVLLPQLGAALGTGVGCALLAVLFIPVFEWLFGRTTDITLLELSDMGHPLLRRLALEAPGTYHHSLMVANLAQSAAERIGAHALLLRVCAYYHDVGKLIKPGHFAENIPCAESPHDDLAPSMSALVIMAHVKEGMALARRFKLPHPILDAIEQHHGTSLIYYFYHRACRLQKERHASKGKNGERAVSESDFRYPGPRPQTREMGILLLADAVEAASRSMEKRTPARIEALVEDIADARLRDGQLSECGLTFADLESVKRSFIFTLANMFHARVPYPSNENPHQQPPAPLSRERAPAPEARPMAHGAGAAA